MANSKTVYKNFRLRGTAVWPKTDQPYTFDQKAKKSFADPKGQYELAVRVEGAALKVVEDNIAHITTSEGFDEVKNNPLTAEVTKDKESGKKSKTGYMLAKAKMYGQSKDGAPKHIKFYGADGKPLPRGFKLTNGSFIEVDVYPAPFDTLGNGIRLNINAIQVLKLADSSHFVSFDVEDGYTADDYEGGDSASSGGSFEDTAKDKAFDPSAF